MTRYHKPRIWHLVLADAYTCDPRRPIATLGEKDNFVSFTFFLLNPDGYNNATDHFSAEESGTVVFSSFLEGLAKMGVFLLLLFFYLLLLFFFFCLFFFFLLSWNLTIADCFVHFRNLQILSIADSWIFYIGMHFRPQSVGNCTERRTDALGLAASDWRVDFTGCCFACHHSSSQKVSIQYCLIFRRRTERSLLFCAQFGFLSMKLFSYSKNGIGVPFLEVIAEGKFYQLWGGGTLLPSLLLAPQVTVSFSNRGKKLSGNSGVYTIFLRPCIAPNCRVCASVLRSDKLCMVWSQF